MGRAIPGGTAAYDDLMEPSGTVEARLDGLETRVALADLVADYAIGADGHDLARWRAIWCDDAVWMAGEQEDQTFRGLDRICWAVQRQWATFPRMQHAMSNHRVLIDGSDEATGQCDVVTLVQLPDLRWVVGGGTYLDAYRRTIDGWKIARRVVDRPFDLEPFAASSGTVFVEVDEDPR